VQGHLRGAAWLLLAVWEASVAAGGDVYALLTDWRPPVGRLAFLFFASPRTHCFHIAPGAAGKADETAGNNHEVQAPLVPEPWKGHNARTT
jgi:hypothetical protein